MQKKSVKERQLLPNHVRPLAYKVTLEPELEPPVLELINAPSSSERGHLDDDSPVGHVRQISKKNNDDDDDALFPFHGCEEITLEVVQTTSTITLHALELHILEAEVNGMHP